MDGRVLWGFCGSKSRGAVLPGSPLIHAESPREIPNHHFQNLGCMTVWEVKSNLISFSLMLRLIYKPPTQSTTIQQDIS